MRRRSATAGLTGLALVLVVWSAGPAAGVTSTASATSAAGGIPVVDDSAASIVPTAVTTGSAVVDDAATAVETGTGGPADADATAVATGLRPGGGSDVLLDLGTGTGRDTYLVELTRPAVPTRRISRDGSARAGATAAGVHRLQLRRDQLDLTLAARAEIGRAPLVRHRYTEVLNGLALELTRREARAVARLDGVRSVVVEGREQPSSDTGPGHIGAPALWQAAPGVPGTRGEGVVVGVVDSGVNPANPSFAVSVPVGQGGDGHVVQNPRGAGTFVGRCDPGSPQYLPGWGCNDKLIGAWDFVGDGVRYADSGHGSHTASTAVGNQVAVPHSGTPTTISGVAPHANLISYRACQVTAAYPNGTCPTGATLAALDQAVLDGVDVLNYSLGSLTPTSAAWQGLQATAFLNLRAAGIHTANSAGNAGPNAATTGSPADLPWVLGVAGASHGRTWRSTLTQFSSGSGGTRPGLSGLSRAGGTNGTAPLVVAGDSYQGSTGLCRAESDWGGQDLAGAIVVCRRGINDRVQKGQVVQARGAVGMVLVDNGSGPVADPHVLPTLHVSQADGVDLLSWIDSAPAPRAAITASGRAVDPTRADILAATSSRGPNRSTPEVLSPAVTAPGTDILAASGTGNAVTWEEMSGTSMATPHVAGALALLVGSGRDWTPAQAQSALMSTAVTSVRDHDGTPATWTEMGAGRIDVAAAARTGLLLDVTPAQYLAADPATGGQVRELNHASLLDSHCVATCEWSRTLTATPTGAGRWSITATGTGPLTLDVPATLDAVPGDPVPLQVRAGLGAGATPGTWYSGSVTLTPPAGSSAPIQHLPVQVRAAAARMPAATTVTTRRAPGSTPVAGFGVDDTQGLEVRHASAPAVPSQHTVGQDPTPTTFFDAPVTEYVTVPPGSTRLRVALSSPTAPDLDLYLGTGAFAAGGLRCSSGGGSSTEVCDVLDPTPGTWWVLAHGYQSGPQGSDVADLSTTVVGAGATTATLGGTPTPGVDFTARVGWDEVPAAGRTRYGTLQLVRAGTAVGTSVFDLVGATTDVTATSSVPQAAPGEEVLHTVEVAPNVAVEDLTWTVTEVIGPGASYVPGSATGGATVQGNTLTWQATLPAGSGTGASFSYRTVVDEETPLGSVLGTTTTHTTSDPAAQPVTEVRELQVADDRAASTTVLSGPGESRADRTTDWRVQVTSTGTEPPTGRVLLMRGSEEVGSALLDASGAAVLTRLRSARGTHTLTARYLGDPHTRRSRSPAHTLRVAAAPVVKVRSTLRVKAPTTVRAPRARGALRVRARAPGVVPTGTLRIRVRGPGVRRTVQVSLVQGQARFRLARLGRLPRSGRLVLRIRYPGDSRVLGARGRVTVRIRP